MLLSSSKFMTSITGSARRVYDTSPPVMRKTYLLLMLNVSFGGYRVSSNRALSCFFTSSILHPRVAGDFILSNRKNLFTCDTKQQQHHTQLKQATQSTNRRAIMPLNDDWVMASANPKATTTSMLGDMLISFAWKFGSVFGAFAVLAVGLLYVKQDSLLYFPGA